MPRLPALTLALLATASLLPAAQRYVDATSGPGGNTRNAATHSLTDWVAGPASTSNFRDHKWGYRTNSGVAENTYARTCYELGTTENDLPIYTEVTGLKPHTTYTGMRVYMIGRANVPGISNNIWPLDASLDGIHWITCHDFDDTGYNGVLVDTSQEGVGIPQTSTVPNEKRIWYALPDASTDADGTLRVYIRRGQGANSRTVYDGIGFNDGEPELPTLGLASVSQVTETSAVLEGTLIANGNSEILEHGFVISETNVNPDPQRDGAAVTDYPLGGGAAEFSLDLETLAIGTSYTFRAYATNRLGTAYSEAVIFVTTTSLDPFSDDVYISEFLASNPGPVVLPGSIADMDGNSPDWIELHNAGHTIADLSGWKLTDDPAQPSLWTFPNGVLLPPGARLVVFASGKDRRLANVELHTNFKLAKSGFLQLSRPGQTGPDVALTSIAYPAQSNRASYGTTTQPPAPLEFGYFTTPTPGQANLTAAVPGYVPEVSVSIGRGVFDTPFSLQFFCPEPGATILYTLDGSAPDATHPATVALPAADAESQPSGSLVIAATTIFRVCAVKDGLGASDIVTHTYLFPNQILTQSAPPANFPPAAPWSHFGTADWAMDPAIVNHPDPASQCTREDLLAIPSLSLVMDWTELFGISGIYPAIPPVAKEGVQKPANLELINPAGNPQNPNSGETFSASGRAHIFGGTSPDRWKVDKLSFNFKAREEVDTGIYGDTSAATHKRFILDGRMGNTWLHATDDKQRVRGDYARDEIAAETQRLMGYAGTHSRRVHLYLNGMYWGLYSLHERPDADFQSAYQGGKSEDWDVLKHSPLVPECLVDGTYVNPALPASIKTNNTAYVNYQALLATVAPKVDLTQYANYLAVGEKLDIDAFIDYILLNFYLGNFDWAHHNWYGSYRRTDPKGRWRFHSWDAEHVLREAYDENVITGGPITDANQKDCPTQIHQRLATSPEYRMRFADRMQLWLFNEALFTTPQLSAICHRQFEEIDAAIRAESARWGDNRATVRPPPNRDVTYTRGVEWLTEKTRILEEVVPARNSLLLDKMKSKTLALYPRVNPGDPHSLIFHAPTFSQHGGQVPLGYPLAMDNVTSGTGSILYTLDGSDPRLVGGAVAPQAHSYTGPVALTSSATVRARAYLNGVWSALSEAVFSVGSVAPAPDNVIISKIMWKPAEPKGNEIDAGYTKNSNFEFLELFNPGRSPVDLTGLQVTHGLDIEITAPAPVELAPGERVVLVAKPSAFLLRHGPGPRVIGKFINGSNLSGSERLTLADSAGTVLTSFVYNNPATGPWPKAETSGTGAALVLIRPETRPDPSLGVNWRASLTHNPSPAADDRPNLAAWQQTWFSGPVDLGADPDHDGLSNLLEFALGQDPHSFDDPARNPTLTVTETASHRVTTLSYRRPRFVTEILTWDMETSENLTDWTAHPPDLEQLSLIPQEDGTETITYQFISPPSRPARFFRLRVAEH